jgi:hypothetical protein
MSTPSWPFPGAPSRPQDKPPADAPLHDPLDGYRKSTL